MGGVADRQAGLRRVRHEVAPPERRHRSVTVLH
jgi:hypothetical protein